MAGGNASTLTGPMVRRAQNEGGSGYGMGMTASATIGASERHFSGPDALLLGGVAPDSETDLCLRRSYDLVERLRRAASLRSAGD
jgi:hypothetical protein